MNTIINFYDDPFEEKWADWLEDEKYEINYDERLKQVYNDEELYYECKNYLDQQLEERFNDYLLTCFNDIVNEINDTYEGTRLITLQPSILASIYVSENMSQLILDIGGKSNIEISGLILDNNGQFNIVLNQSYNLPIFLITDKGEDYLMDLMNNDEYSSYPEDLIEEHIEEFSKPENKYTKPLIYSN